ncbi:metallophosphoesterase family protein [Butyricimonas hominis]|jgi:hypothetical protein|uniref:Metallophosphoesterase family protein n=1 Tax=Butyricimonas hominis TaxID=2763032 RepID=A0ABR7D1U5_9BACT|nr:metallophosphoesterase family protein [Butyricimonas hominis]MBC5621906.1 metallophosphoesterase family protein [Butyricimonas hominis]
MGSKFVILSDIHANLSALKAVIRDFKEKYKPDGIFFLGDIINYGMRPNEVILEIKALSKEYEVMCNLFGNHEKALMDSTHFSRFSSERGRVTLKYTKDILTADSYEYIQSRMQGEGYAEILLNGRSVLCLHGELRDVYWGKLTSESMKEESYSKYDYVLSGHTHFPLHVEMFYAGGCIEFRGKKRTVFMNPGSIGQPRNHNPKAQYLYWDMGTDTFHYNAVEYDIALEQSLYTDAVDVFYKNRLLNGI